MLRLSGPDAVEVCRQLAGAVEFLVVGGDAIDDDEVSRLARAVDLPIAQEISPNSPPVLSHRSTLVVTNADEAAIRHLTARHEVIVRLSSPSVELAATLLGAGAKAVLATESALISSGPGWFQRVTGLIVKADPGSQDDKSGVAWASGVAFGLGMIGGGLGAAVVALGPVLLPYDAAFLGLNVDRLRAINPQLIHFLQHDRITLAGTMVALGIFYFALSWFGIRRRRAWARDAMLSSGIVGFPTLFYFFSFHYVEPVHVALALVLFPLFLIAIWRRPPRGLALVDGDESPSQRSRAMLGQLLMAATGFGLVAGGITISLVGLSTVFVTSDLTFMSTSPTSLAEANARLVGFVAHDRAGFGGALISSGVAVFLIAAWGWHRGEAWVWWSLFAAAFAGFGAAIGVHYWVGYTYFFHLAPVYVGTLLSALSLGLSRPYLLARQAGTDQSTRLGNTDQTEVIGGHNAAFPADRG